MSEKVFEKSVGNGSKSSQVTINSPRLASAKLAGLPTDLSLDSSIKHRTDTGVALIGNDFKPADKRKFRYDTIAGATRRKPIVVTRDDRMTPEEAGTVLEQIHIFCGVDKADEGIEMSFDHALFVCIALNSSSVMVPGRSSFGVAGVTRNFEYEEIRLKLGIDFRRFARAFADDIRDALIQELKDYNPMDFDSVALCEGIREVAFKRGLQRYPHLMHDSADACTKLSVSERLALIHCKDSYVASRNNAADALILER